MKNDLPNFDQFIEFVLDMHFQDDNIDDNLKFFWENCDMCMMHYDIIGKAETYKEDLNYIFTKLPKVSLKSSSFESVTIAQ